MNNKTKARCDELHAMGLKFDFNINGDGGNYIYLGINFNWTDILCYSDAEWQKAITGTKMNKLIIDEQTMEQIKNSIELKTLPFLKNGETPENLTIDRMGVSYMDSFNREIICQPNGCGVWVDKIFVPYEIPFDYILETSQKFQ
jgi:hypothetical protein